MSELNNNVPPAKPASVGRKLGIGLAVVSVPVAAAFTILQLKQSEDAHNEDLERQFKYDLGSLSQIDPALIGYQQVGVIQTHLQDPTCFAIAPDGKLLVGGAKLVKVLDPRGQELLSFSIPSASTAIAGSADGDIYVAIKDHVAVYSSAGQIKNTFPTLGPSAHISSLALSNSALYVADSGQRTGRALIFSLDGKLTGQLAKADQAKGIPGIITPSTHMDLAVTADGNIWVANPGHRQLELYSPSGEMLRAFGSSGTNIDQFLGCCNPSDFALLSDGRLVTAEKGVARVKIYQDDGHFQTVVAPPSAFGSNRAGLDLAADSTGRILILEPGTADIRIFAEAKK